MKTVIVFFLMLISIVSFGQIDTTATSGGFGGFYEKWGDLLWVVLGALGVTGWLGYRLSKALALIRTVVDAFEDGKLTTPEAKAIGLAAQELVGKKKP